MRPVGLGAELLAAEALVGLEVPLEPPDLRVALEREYVSGDPVEEPAVVRDDDSAAREREQRVHVEVVGRLVEQQQVAALAQKLGEVEPVAFAPGQLGDLLLLVSALEVEARDVRAAVDGPLAQLDLVLSARDLLPDGLFGIQLS